MTGKEGPAFWGKRKCPIFHVSVHRIVRDCPPMDFLFKSLHSFETPPCLSCAFGVRTCSVKTRSNRTPRPRATSQRWMLALGDAKYKDRHYRYLTPIEPFVTVIEVIVVTLHRLVSG